MTERRRVQIALGDRAPLAWSRRLDKPREPDFLRDVIGVVFLVSFLAGAAAWSLAWLLGHVLTALWPAYAQVEGAGWMATLFVTSMAGLVTSIQRLRVWDQSLQLMPYTEHHYQEVEVVTPDYRPTRVVTNGQERMVPMRRQAVVLRHDGQSFELSGQQMDRISRWHKEGHGSIRRNSNHLGPGFDQLGITSGEDYGRLRAILQGLGYVDDQNKWTDRGQAWAESAGLPQTGAA